MNPLDVQELTIGFRNAGKVVVYFEPFTQPHDEVILAEARRISGKITGYGSGDESSVTCSIFDGSLTWQGTIDPEEVRDALEEIVLRATLAMNIAILAYNSYPWVKYLREIEEHLDRPLYVDVLQHPERVRINPIENPSEIADARCSIEQSGCGTVVTIPGYPDTLPFGVWVNEQLKGRLIDAMARVIALESTDDKSA